MVYIYIFWTPLPKQTKKPTKQTSTGKQETTKTRNMFFLEMVCNVPLPAFLLCHH